MKTKRVVGLFVVVAFLAAAPETDGATILPDQGLQFSQLDLAFTGAVQSNSAYGIAAVDIATLTAGSGLDSGYLNISSTAGWVVQNMPIQSSSQLPGLSTMFNLGNTAGARVASLQVAADFSATPVAGFATAPGTTFAVGTATYNAEGVGGSRDAPPASAVDTSVISWTSGGGTVSHWQPGHPSVDQDKNQCAPASVANSLQWLAGSQELELPFSNAPGIRDDTLVGQLDVAMNRAAHGAVASAEAMFNGKTSFINDADNGLAGKLTMKRWDGTVGWIIDEIEHGENVELVIYWDGGGGHAVDLIGAGMIDGTPWLAWTHDAYQSNTPNGAGTHWYDGGLGWSPVVDGKLVAFIEGKFAAATVGDAMSESIRPVPEPATWIAGLFGCLVCAWSYCARRHREREHT